MTLPLILAILVLVILIGLVLGAIIRIVPHEERLVIYRLGHFDRVAGPGPVIVIPKLDQVVKKLRVRDQPIEITIDGLFPFGVPVGMTLNIWCRYDLVKAAGDDHARLADLVQLTESERRQQVEVKVREALVRQIAMLQERSPLPANAGIQDRLVALAPGTPRYNELLDAVKNELQQTLPSVGAVLNPDQTITLTKRNVPDEIINALKRLRGREIDSVWLTNYASKLREQFPGMSNAVLAQLLSSIEGVDVARVQRLLLEQEPGIGAEVEYEMARDGEGPNIITRPKPGERGEEERPGRVQPHAEKDRSSDRSEVLTKEDLSVLKRVPRADRDEQLSA